MQLHNPGSQCYGYFLCFHIIPNQVNNSEYVQLIIAEAISNNLMKTNER